MKRTIFVLVALLSMAMSFAAGWAQAVTGEHSIIINLPEYKLYHYIGEELVQVYSISIGHINSPTPVSSDTRRFEIYVKVKNPAWSYNGVITPAGPTNPLGTRWLGLMTIDKVTLTGTESWESLAKKYGTAVSSILNQNNLKPGAQILPGMVVEIPHSDGYGIHGTTVPNSIGTSVSLGCMRMHNAQVEKLFDALPNGKRIPVTIKYAPLAERIDALTGEVYYEVYHDIYRRVKDWPGHLAAAAGRIGAQLSQWMQSTSNQKFTGSLLVSSSPAIYNNGVLIAVGAHQQDGQFFIPAAIVEQILGERYVVVDGNRYLGSSFLDPEMVLVVNDMFYLNAAIVRERTGKGHYYEPMLNMLQFSNTRLTVDGEVVSYNGVFVHPTLGAMIAISDLTEALNLELIDLTQGRVDVGGTILKGEQIGSFIYMTTSELARLGVGVHWSPQSGELAVVTTTVVTEP